MSGYKKESLQFYREFIRLAEGNPEWYESVRKAERAVNDLKNAI